MSDKGQPLYVTDPEAWLKETAHGPDLCCLVIFRGSWCKYDKHYLTKLGECYQKTMKKEGKASGGVKLIAWTSQGVAGAAEADKAWNLTSTVGFDQVIGDETNALAQYLIDDAVLPDLKIATADEAKIVLESVGADAATSASYPNGMAMPGVVWYAHHGSLVFQWESKTFEAPVWCGPNRPEPNEMWTMLLKRKHALDQGSAVKSSHGAEMKLCTNDTDMGNCNVL